MNASLIKQIEQARLTAYERRLRQAKCEHIRELQGPFRDELYFECPKCGYGWFEEQEKT